MVWYQGSRNSDGSYEANVEISRHKTAGEYQSHVYITLADGTQKLLGATQFTVSDLKCEKISVENYNEATGAFRVKIEGVESPSGIKNVSVPVWCSADQSDIRWYTAEKVSEKEYMVYVDPVYHQSHSGEYKIHVYVDAGNGVSAIVGTTSCNVQAPGLYSIMGDTTTDAAQLERYYISSGHVYPSSIYASRGAADLSTFCRIYIEEAAAEGVRAEVAFAQSMLETGWLQFSPTGIVKPEQCNFAGLGAVDGNSQGQCASFPDVRTGVRAQIQHLKAYGSRNALNNSCVDPRFHLVSRGTALYVQYLGQKENPLGVGWATSPGYGYRIVNMIYSLKEQ